MRASGADAYACAMVDEGAAVHYSAVQRGTPVYSADGSEVGAVQDVLDNYREHIFDGVVFRDLDGVLRFADAPEVARTAERAVTLTLTEDEAKQLGPPEKGSTRFVPPSGGRLGKLFGGNRKRNR